ncbi:MAG TPA: gliding motility lipoprotein GldH [Chitinophagaceae bacterium]|nr:gliding motility lipoprotein GldH [Chitinophagaceae bacterium]
MRIFNPYRFYWLSAICSQLITVSCSTVDLYEKTVTLPNHQWNSNYLPEFNFTIKDSIALYQVYFVIRHNEKYNFNNIWINLYSQPPGDTLHKTPYELILATNEKGWLATGMDDIYEHRIKLTDAIRLKTGDYKLRIENIMREDPLMQVMSVGLRVEKKQ